MPIKSSFVATTPCKRTLAALAVFALIAAFMAPLSAAQNGALVITNETPFYLYAQGVGQWVRTHTAYGADPMRAADGISKSQATRYIIDSTGIYGNGPIGMPTGPLAFSLRAPDMPHKYCAPSNATGSWGQGTLLCLYDTRPTPWLRLSSADSESLVRIGGSVYLQDVATGRYCTAPSWPTNQAGLICDSSRATDYQKFHIEA